MRETLLIAAVICLTACGDASSDKAKTESSGNPITAPVDYVGAVGTAKKRAEQRLDLTPVTRAINDFKAAEGRAPTSLQELVTEGHLARMPEAPSGMRFDYSAASGTVRLVKE